MSIISTQGFTFRLMASGSDGYQQLDIFDDEDITISNNITGLFDIGVLPSDFTKDITLPGSKVNNAFFEHVYDISIDNPYLFATNQKVAAYFDFDSVYLSQGYLQLNSVNVKANKFIESYNVTIYGALSSFGRDISRYFLTDLTSLSVYNHTSSYDNIVKSWSTSSALFNGDIVYPLADYGQGWQYTPSDVYTGIDSNEGALNVQDFKPAIRIKPVIDAIFNEAGFTYTSSFLNQDFINDIYLVCNNSLRYPEYPNVDLETLGVVKLSPLSGSGTDLIVPQETITNLPWYNVERDPSGVVGSNSSYKITLDHSSSLSGIINLNINMSGSLGGATCELIVRDTGSLSTVSLTTLPNISNYFFARTYQDFAAGNTGQNQTTQVQQEFRTSLIGPGTYYFALNWRDQFNAPYNNFLFTLDPGATSKSYIEIKKVNQAADGEVLDIPSNMPFGTTGIKQIDFILGLQKKFNLIIYPSKIKPNEFLIETFNTWYKQGERKDFNKYINLDNTIEVIPANNLAVNELTFGDTLDQDYISQQFSKEANREFGKQYYIDTANYFSQGKFEVKTTFASDPLIRLAGTGLSGSVSGINPQPTEYLVGTLHYGYSYYAPDTCNSSAYIITYTDTGRLQSGLIAYADAYGQSPIRGLQFVVDPSSYEIYTLNPSTGEIGYGTGYYC
jgi:hypothetical protein